MNKETEEKVRKIVEEKLSCSSHDFDHTQRVYNTCLELAEGQNVDLEVLRLSALLHDIARAEEDEDNAGSKDHAELGAEAAGKILSQFDIPKEKIKKIQKCIYSHRYRNNHEPESKEAKILFDADKLDVLGAIGIARAFVWVGENNANIYKKVNLKEYAKENLKGGFGGKIKDPSKHSPQIEFSTKCKNLPKRMYTKEGRKMAEERLKFFKNFLSRLEKEIKGEK